MVAANHAYVVDFALEAAGSRGRILDFGCGSGDVVEAARNAGLSAWGADIFNRRNDSLRRIAARGLGSICVVEEGRIPYRDASFDVVLSNQVFEHVFGLDTTLAEIRRVLRKGGVLLALFPSSDVWREGHCGVPFVHRLRRDSHLRVPYMLAARAAGLGAKKDSRPWKTWARDHLDYIDHYTIYRSASAIEEAFARHFESVVHVEAEYCQYRLRHLGWNAAARLADHRVTSWLCRKLASMVMVCEKSQPASIEGPVIASSPRE